MSRDVRIITQLQDFISDNVFAIQINPFIEPYANVEESSKILPS